MKKKPHCKNCKRIIDLRKLPKGYCLICFYRFHPMKQIRISKNLSQEKFAELIYVTQSSICKIEKGKLKPTLDMMVTLKDEYEVNLNQFVIKCQDFIINRRMQQHDS